MILAIDYNTMNILNITDYCFNFEIRVGEDGENIGNNNIFAHQYEEMSNAWKKFTCSPVIFGDWVSINKSSSYHGDERRLALNEVRVFSEY